jgi:iron-sulfur cluster repair protein YtfE (RIC family)
MLDGDSTLPDWLIDVPASAAVFERYGLDTSCGGKSLDYICCHAGIDPQQVLTELRGLESPPTDRDHPFRQS